MNIEPSNLSFNAIREYAQRVGEHHDAWDERGHMDIAALLAKVGGATHNSSGGQSIVVSKPGNFQIGVMVPGSRSRRRFAAAHSLGHYFLHYRHPGLSGIRIFECGGEAAAEVQANVFAATLMMPTQQFAAAYTEHGGDVWKLAVQFGTSPKAAVVRAQVLELDGARSPIRLR